jgi:hypothetical protein
MEGVKDIVSELIKGSIQKQLLIARPSLTYNGQPKPVNSKYQAPLPSPRLNTSVLYNSVEVYYETDLDDGELRLVVDFGTANYWYWVNFGRKPSVRYPNIKDIQDWVESKPALNYPELTVEQRTFLVARSIKEYGFAGINFIENAAKETAKDVEDLFGVYTADWFRNLLGKRIKAVFEKPNKYGPGKEITFEVKID